MAEAGALSILTRVAIIPSSELSSRAMRKPTVSGPGAGVGAGVGDTVGGAGVGTGVGCKVDCGVGTTGDGVGTVGTGVGSTTGVSVGAPVGKLVGKGVGVSCVRLLWLSDWTLVKVIKLSLIEVAAANPTLSEYWRSAFPR
jgi:hypothetical protein